MSESPLKVWLEKDGALLRLRLARPKANIVDAAMIAALQAALTEHLPSAKLRAVLLDAEGPHFSFGASVEEHMPESCAAMLQSLHALVIQMLESPVPVLVAVRGQCLGGGLEVVAAGNLIFAAPGAMLGQPEIKIGVFAPAASCLLPERIGKTASEDLLFSGRSITAEEGFRIGLVTAVAEDPEQAAVAYFDEHLAGLSASSLRFAVRAARIGVLERTKTKIAAVEKLYLEELMATHDAVEGLNAFLGKRPAAWQDR
ncbi:cyclohexa-1,5-dienecarbonyl-CoA hydratase [Geobacter metallireducens RCH3]|uniref:Cyclohexa-1,5-dienecarbonyl-CoA hydratase n=1 Tax=Geobacter metallireducens (strain ATCC 53774 / DSM 7210 / GS-15) TaxID=269799 RepID=Q39TP5_GEOMG|nr:cyclohexa-1,5-dienecarbonyl-CoA hydratase [Geobacter metallireducens]ABB32379.1 cyclohexa-1,5-dienecarbonyl-CoA hydratase [Geobacter metallireducens GS-15]EHP86731.1 cyclohexa-1,5-dienecarbonyl-CoA hydratase [Geobacter metallireducens RCH3]